MKFLIDVCAGSRDMRETLAELGHDAIFAADIDPKASDETLLALSTEQGRILVTEDKDFGDPVFVLGLPTRESSDSQNWTLQRKPLLWNT